MSSTDTLYQIRAETLEQIERGRDNLLRLRVYSGGTLTPPASATVTLYDSAGTSIATPAVTIVSGEARATVLAATTAALQRGMGWRLEWVLTGSDGVVRTYRQEAALVTCRLLPPISIRDLFGRVSSLDPEGTAPITKTPPAAFDRWIADAWSTIERKLNRDGRRPWLIMSPQDLREVHLLTVLVLVFQDLATRLNPAHMESVRTYRADLAAEWGLVRFSYDSDDDGRADGGASPTRQGAQTSVWLSTSGTGPRTGDWR